MARETIKTPEFRVSFAAVFRPNKPQDATAEPKYGLTMLFKKGENLTPLKKAAEAAIVEKWGADKTKWPKNLRSPFRDQGEKAFEGYEPGAIFVNATSRQRPGLVDAQVQDIIDETEFYSGCYARATLTVFAYDKAGNKGVAFGLQNIQKLRDGEPLSGRTKASDDFEPVEGTGDDTPPADATSIF